MGPSQGSPSRTWQAENFLFQVLQRSGGDLAPLQTPGPEHEAVTPPVHCNLPAHLLFFLLHLLHRNTVLPFPPPLDQLLLSPALPPEQCQPLSGTSIISDGTSWCESGIDLPWLFTLSASLTKKNLNNYCIPILLLTQLHGKIGKALSIKPELIALSQGPLHSSTTSTQLCLKMISWNLYVNPGLVCSPQTQCRFVCAAPVTTFWNLDCPHRKAWPKEWSTETLGHVTAEVGTYSQSPLDTKDLKEESLAKLHCPSLEEGNWLCHVLLLWWSLNTICSSQMLKEESPAHL